MKSLVEQARDIVNGNLMFADQRTVLAQAVIDLSEALEEIAKQHLSSELEDEIREDADFDLAYDICVDKARAALEKVNGKTNEGA